MVLTYDGNAMVRRKMGFGRWRRKDYNRFNESIAVCNE